MVALFTIGQRVSVNGSPGTVQDIYLNVVDEPLYLVAMDDGGSGVARESSMVAL